MFRQKVIQKGVAGLLSMILLLGILPKPVVHEWLTGHEHAVTLASDDLQLTSSNNLLSCECDWAVFASPFEAVSESVAATLVTSHPYFSTYILNTFTDNLPDQRALRGPPAHL